MTFCFQFNDVHTFGNADRIRPRHLSLDLTLNFEKKEILGRCILHMAYENLDQAPAYLDLDIAQMTIDSVLDEDRKTPLKYEIGPIRPFMGQRLRIILPDGKPKRIGIAYRTKPEAAALQWLDPAQTTAKKHPFLFTQSQSILARTWIPCMDSPGVRVSYDATVRVPKGITVVMSAFHKQHQPEEGIFRFDMPLPIPPYLIALAAGDLVFKPLSERTGVYAEPAVLEKAAWEFADMEKMIVATEKLYGGYSWDRWDAIVLPPSFPFGGMENPMLTFATPTLIAGDRSLVNVMAHELAHSWSGNLVTNATWSDFWLNEGFTTYIERRIVEEIYGEDVAEMQKLLGQNDLNESLKEISQINPKDTILFIDLKDRDPDEGFTDIPYEKGANFLLILEHRFGRPKFDAFLKTYFEEHALQSMTTAKFLQYLKKHLFSGSESLWKELKVEEWIYREGLPSNMIIPHSDKFEKTRAAAKTFLENGSLAGVDAEKWTTAEWLDFLNTLPAKLSRQNLEKLDQAFAFTRTGNSEILCSWLRISIRNDYEAAFETLEDFLIRQGRRKFLKPLYQELMDNPKTQTLAKQIFKKARSGYHPLSATTVDKIVK